MRCEVDDCGRPTIARGMCSKHYQRWKRQNPHATTPSERGVPAIDRLLGRCIDVDGCWIYQGSTDRAGYVRLRGADGRKVFGHRLSWEYFVGPFPDCLTYDHLCRNKACVTPWHGEPVPTGVNSKRAPANLASINHLKTHCPQGHPLSGDNLRFATRGKGRVCRKCRADSCAKYRLQKKEAS